VSLSYNKDIMLRRMKIKSKDQLTQGSSRISVSSSSSSSSVESYNKPIHGFYIPSAQNNEFLSDSSSESCVERTSMKRAISPQFTFQEFPPYFPLSVPTIVNVVPPFTKDIVKKRKTHGLAMACSKPILYLGTKEDDNSLNKIHCFVRRNIEVFVATIEDVSAPCPGRKTALKAGQVGLRCVHCRNVDSRHRVKRAVCYPSNISRIYNCVSDMKFDHFSHCKFLPVSERETFDILKADKTSNARGKGGHSTARYYYESAMSIGLFEHRDGIVSLQKEIGLTKKEAISMLPPMNTRQTSSAHNSDSNNARNGILANIYPDRCLLATPEDEYNLNPIHCFVRKNVEVFIANESDVLAPAPGRKKRITFGQVGIRCIHCKSIAPRYRVKRSICYPPSIANLYHAVSNMKFDHYGACTGLSPTARQQFSDLKATSSSRKKGGKSLLQSTSRTASYYQKSAVKEFGLIDTENGIRVHHNRFVRSGLNFSQKESPTIIATIPPLPTLLFANEAPEKTTYPPKVVLMDGVSALMLAASDCDIKEQYEMSKCSVHTVAI
jgi:hypothetical protein